MLEINFYSKINIYTFTLYIKYHYCSSNACFNSWPLTISFLILKVSRLKLLRCISTVKLLYKYLHYTWNIIVLLLLLALILLIMFVLILDQWQFLCFWFSMHFFCKIFRNAFLLCNRSIYIYIIYIKYHYSAINFCFHSWPWTMDHDSLIDFLCIKNI